MRLNRGAEVTRYPRVFDVGKRPFVVRNRTNQEGFFLLERAPELAPRWTSSPSRGEVDYPMFSPWVNFDSSISLLPGFKDSYELQCCGGYCFLMVTNLVLIEFDIKFREDRKTGARELVYLRTNEFVIPVSGARLTNIQGALIGISSPARSGTNQAAGSMK